MKRKLRTGIFVCAGLLLLVGALLRSYSPHKESLDESVSHLVAQHTELSEEELQIVRQVKGVDINEGIEGEAIFFIRGQGGQSLYVVKVYREEGPMDREVSAFSLLSTLDLKTARIPTLKAAGPTRVARGDRFLVIYEFLPGDPASALFQKIALATSPAQREVAFTKAARGVSAIGRALAELHSARAGISSEVAPYFVDKEERVLAKFLEALEKHPRLLTVSAEKFTELFRKLQEARTSAPCCHTYAHLDSHLANWLYEETSDTLAMIDLESLHNSIGDLGEPVASPWIDYLTACLDVAGMGNLYGLSHKEVEALQEAFHKAYDATVTLPNPHPDELAFYSLYYWMKMVTIFDGAAPNEPLLIAQQKGKMAHWAASGLAHCVKDLVPNNGRSKHKQYRQSKAASRKWIVGL